MLPTNLLNGLKAYSNSGQSQIALSSDVTTSPAKLEIGQVLQGSVLSKLSDGLFNVQVAGQAIQMRLPGNMRNGELIKLEVVATRPRITFNMIPSTNPLANPEQISATAKILSNLAELPAEMQTLQQLGSKAVWHAEQHVPDAKLLALELRDALGKTGLFYESHQAQWVRGERSTDQLLNEPQNILTGKIPSTQAPDHETTGEANAKPTLSQEILRRGELAGSDDLREVQFLNPDKNVLPAQKELLNLVQQQLHTLEHHQLTWMGQIWPEQDMQWKIQGEPEHQAEYGHERQWSTEIELTLPHLGEIKARLLFSAGGLSLSLHSAEAKTMAVFDQALPQLKNSLANANIKVVSAIVDR